jgi:hypothetical protein
VNGFGEDRSMGEPMGGTGPGDLLISRVVDGVAQDSDWAEFRALAEHEPSLWRELAETQHEHTELSALVAAAIAVADDVDAPVKEEMDRRFSERMRLVGTWGGWAAAAAIVLVWATGGGALGLLTGGPEVQQGNFGPSIHYPQTASDALQSYLDRGREERRVVGEIPSQVLLEARPLKAGGYELIYLRQIMERRVVKELNTVAQDETGRPVAVPYKSGATGAAGPY